MSQRPPKPEFLKKHENWIKAGPPKCCHTCENYDQKGVCLHYGMVPPEDFAAKTDACADWAEEIPF